jgi:iron(III) transport system permease protein
VTSQPIASRGPEHPQRWHAKRGPAITTELTVVLALCLLLTILVVAPLVAVVLSALADDSGVTWRALSNVLTSTRIIGNTIYVALCATLLSLVTGGLLAIILIRVETPGRRVLEALVTLPLYLTPLLTAVAWSWLGSPRGGLINLFWREGLGLGERLVNLQSAEGVIFVAALAYTPLPFLLIGGALRGMDPSLEDSGRVQGASAAVVLARVTLPLVLPAALGSALLVLVQCMGLFSVPAVLGMPSGFYVAGTEIYRLLNNYPPRVGQAAAWGLLLLMTTAALVALQTAILSGRSYATVTGKAFRPRPFTVGPVRYLLAFFAWVYVGAAVVLPVLALIWAALVNFITIDIKLMQFDARHFTYVLFQYPKTYLAFQNSVLLGIGTATVVCLIGLAVGWVLVRTRSPARGLLDQLSMMPLAIPSMVLALGLLWTYVGLRFLPIYGTIWILFIGYVTHYLPFGVRASSAALRQLHPELEDAARVGGAGWLATMRLIVLPLTRPTLIAIWTLLFILSLQEVSSSILLYTSRTVVLSVAVFDLWEAGNVSALAALSVMQLSLTFLMLLVLVRARHREVLV